MAYVMLLHIARFNASNWQSDECSRFVSNLMVHATTRPIAFRSSQRFANDAGVVDAAGSACQTLDVQLSRMCVRIIAEASVRVCVCVAA